MVYVPVLNQLSITTENELAKDSLVCGNKNIGSTGAGRGGGIAANPGF
jgi:hypothetical protein